MTSIQNKKQNILDDKWVIKIGGGFSQQNQSSYPSGRLTAFLNFSPKTKKEAGEFCTKYQIIPPGLDLEKDNILEAIAQEQNLIKPIVKKIISGNEIMDSELETIKEKIGTIRKSLTRVTSEKLNKTNQLLSPQTEIITGSYLIDTSTHNNSVASLWEDLANAITKHDLKTCINCGAFFQIKSDHNRKFCDNLNCSNNYRQRKARKLNK